AQCDDPITQSEGDAEPLVSAISLDHDVASKQTHYSNASDESQSTAASQDRNHSQAMLTGLTPEECLVKADKEFAATRYDQSWEYAQQAILGRPFNPEAVYLMGKIALLAGDQPKVESCVEALEQMTPKWELKQLLEDELSAMQAGPLLLTLSPIRCFGSGDRLSVCMIAKNEASFIGQAIDSVQDIAHEIIVVDTGSTDETVEIARSKGAKVIETVWEDDFSQARNIYLKHATGDWILVLDADECLAAEDLPLLKEDLRKPNAICLRLPIYNHGANEYGRGFVPRLFRNAPWITYQGAIHEQIHAHIVALNQQWDTETTLGSTPIQHYGYQDHVIKAKGKRERNLMMLQKAIETREGDPNIEYNYALELRNAGKMDESLLHFRKAFELIRDLPESHQVQEFNLAVVQQLATVLFSMKDYQGVLQLTEEAFVKQLGMFASLSLLVSMASQAMGDHENTLIYAEQCIALRDQPVMIPGILDVQTGLPHILIARALINLERFEESEAAYAAALERCPDRLDYLLESCHALQKRQETLKALDLLSNQVERFGQVRDFWMAGFGFALEDAHLWPFAFDWGTEALKYFKDQRDICYAYLMAAMLNGHWNKAAAFHAEFTPHPTNAQENAVEIMLLLSQGKQPTLHPSVAEKQCSEAFMQFYRRLLTGNNGNAIRTINDHLEGMEACLPSASGLIRQALKTTQTHAVG
ncbi:MAG: glycosyltransferase, partial [Limisphaerales bacterium]